MKTVNHEGEDNAMRSRMALLVGIFIFVLMTLVVAPISLQHAQLDLPSKAIGYAAELNNVPTDRLAIANTAWLDGEIFRAKVVDYGSGEIYVVNIHSSGELATDQEVTDLLRAYLQKGFVGKVVASLKARVEADPSGSSRVIIWVKTPQIPKAEWRTALEQGRREEVFKASAAFHAQAEMRVLESLHSLGIKEKYASQYAPAITCEIPNSLLGQLESLPEVARIYEDNIAAPALYSTVPTIKAQKVWNQGITGSGVTVAVVEAFVDGHNAIAGNNPKLGSVTYYKPENPQPSRHATEVAGIIASTDSVYNGVSYDVVRPILSGNPIDPYYSGVNAATSWSASQGANVINQSYRSNVPTGDIGAMGLYDDYIVGLYFPTIVVCAGNYDIYSNFSYLVDDPAVAYNVIAVGAFAHNGDSDWTNDSMAGYTTYLNPGCPLHCREKPEIAAPGNVYSTFELAPWVPKFNNGTSFAAPHVAGTAALLMQAKASLKTAPEEVKAILMASAVHNIEGASRLSEYDGAGGLQAKAAYDVTIKGWSSYFRDQSLGSCRTVSFNATAGQIVRFTICWLSHAYCFNDQCDGYDVATDNDLVLKDPGGATVATSASFDNNFEIVEFTASSTGTYTASVCWKGFGIGFKPNFGWAYYLQ